MKHDQKFTILMADDDLDDQLMTKEALDEIKLPIELNFVADGVELMDYLNKQGSYTAPASAPAPGLILLDLNMPKKDGREALKEIKEDPLLRHIPIVILTTSKAIEDIYRAYGLGVNSFVTKPVSFDGLVETMHTIVKYWFETVELPQPHEQLM